METRGDSFPSWYKPLRAHWAPISTGVEIQASLTSKLQAPLERPSSPGCSPFRGESKAPLTSPWDGHYGNYPGNFWF